MFSSRNQLHASLNWNHLTSSVANESIQNVQLMCLLTAKLFRIFGGAIYHFLRAAYGSEVPGVVIKESEAGLQER